jgi:hypothetical protein
VKKAYTFAGSSALIMMWSIRRMGGAVGCAAESKLAKANRIVAATKEGVRRDISVYEVTVQLQMTA